MVEEVEANDLICFIEFGVIKVTLRRRVMLMSPVEAGVGSLG